jgi:hypothetical protein
MSCEQARQEYEDATEAHAAAAQRLKRQERMMFANTTPAAILLSDQDLETIRRLEAEEEETGLLERGKALAYEQAKRSHVEQ